MHKWKLVTAEPLGRPALKERMFTAIQKESFTGESHSQKQYHSVQGNTSPRWTLLEGLRGIYPPISCHFSPLAEPTGHQRKREPIFQIGEPPGMCEKYIQVGTDLKISGMPPFCIPSSSPSCQSQFSKQHHSSPPAINQKLTLHLCCCMALYNTISLQPCNPKSPSLLFMTHLCSLPTHITTSLHKTLLPLLLPFLSSLYRVQRFFFTSLFFEILRGFCSVLYLQHLVQ